MTNTKRLGVALVGVRVKREEARRGCGCSSSRCTCQERKEAERECECSSSRCTCHERKGAERACALEGVSVKTTQEKSRQHKRSVGVALEGVRASRGREEAGRASGSFS